MIYKVNRDFTREEFLQKFGESSTYPRVVVDGELSVDVKKQSIT